MNDEKRPPGVPAGPDDGTIPAGANPDQAPASLFSGRYRIERVIGQGAFGRVYLAFDTRLRRNVAVKELLATRSKTDSTTYERYLERFQREARAAGVVQNPNIVAVHELAIDSDENYYLMMEYVDGTDLRDLLAQVGTLPVERAVTIALEVARALDAVHEQDIVHRDLKPANIMLTRRGVTKVTDFGIAQVGQESQRTQIVSGHPGTPIYMSPEQASGSGYLDGRSDLYSLGLVLYEMLVGEPYARKRQPLNVARPDLSPQLVAIVNKLMARDPNDRYQHAGEVMEALGALSGTRASATLTDAPTYQPPINDGATLPGSLGTQSPPLGVPSAYGGAASQSAPGAPFYTGVTPPPGTGGALPYAPPPMPGAGNNKRGLWLGLGAVGLAAVIAVIGFIAFAGKSNPTPATASPRGGTAVVSPGAGTAGTTGTAATAVIGSPVPANTFVVADAKNLITYAYPKEWHAGGVTEFDTDIVAGYTIFNPYSIFSVAKEDLTAPTTLDAYTDDYIARRFRKSPDWKPGPINKQNAKIAGQDARIIDFLQPSTTDGGIAPKGGTIYQYAVVTLHDNRAWTIGYATADEQKDVVQKQFDTLANTFGFCPTTGCTRQQTVPTIATGQTTKWADSAQLLTAEYPADWFAYPDDKLQGRSLALSSPDGVFFNIYVFDTAPTVDEEMQSILDNHAKATDVKYTDAPVTDATVAGEPGKVLSYTYVPTSDPGAKARNGLVWVVNHGGKQFIFQGLDIKARRADIEKIVGSVTFTGPAATVAPQATPIPTPRSTVVPTNTPKPQPTPTSGSQALRTWVDPNGALKFQYPSAWTESKDTTVATNIITVGDGNTVGIRVFAFDPGTDTIDESFQRLRDRDSNDGTTIRVYDPVLDTKVGGLPAKSVAYRYTAKDKPNDTPGIATIWLVDHNGVRYQFSCSNLATNRAQILAVIDSVVFLK
ncbi:MAG: protein kinase domain-containing protein [Thermomicrobiales bacterium]